MWEIQKGSFGERGFMGITYQSLFLIQKKDCHLSKVRGNLLTCAKVKDCVYPKVVN